MSQTSSHEKARKFADRMQVIGPIAVTRFFGGAGLVWNGYQFAFVIEDVLYLRVDDFSRHEYETLGSVPFTYATRSKIVKVASYYSLPDTIAEDNEELIRWTTRACDAAIVAKVTKRTRKI